MSDRMFGFGEDDILSKYPAAIKHVDEQVSGVILDNNVSYQEVVGNPFTPLRDDNNSGDAFGNVNKRTNVRVRTDASGVNKYNGADVNSTDSSFGNYGMMGSYEQSNMKGASFVLIVASVITLVALVAIVTIGIVRILSI